AGYSHRWMSEVFPTLLEEVLKEPMRLEALGIVDSNKLREGCERYPRRPEANLRVSLFYTVQTELWLRGRTLEAPEVNGALSRRREDYLRTWSDPAATTVAG
ncbi:MAG TPA: hypothetical protein VK966_09885, partial [Longimicrobiales bacterium]|nr:hypothetical protein [Longimicrobiales bacterium]